MVRGKKRGTGKGINRLLATGPQFKRANGGKGGKATTAAAKAIRAGEKSLRKRGTIATSVLEKMPEASQNFAMALAASAMSYGGGHKGNSHKDNMRGFRKGMRMMGKKSVRRTKAGQGWLRW